MLPGRRLYQAALIAAVASAAGPAHAGQCSNIAEASARLACYDQENPVATNTTSPRKIDILDFKVEKEALMGTRVILSGYAFYSGPILLLKVSRKLTAGVGIYIDGKALPKDDQKRLLSSCELERPCAVTIEGVVSPATFGEVAADKIRFEKITR